MALCAGAQPFLRVTHPENKFQQGVQFSEARISRTRCARRGKLRVPVPRGAPIEKRTRLYLLQRFARSVLGIENTTPRSLRLLKPDSRNTES
jgi:hypothetical protein